MRFLVQIGSSIQTAVTSYLNPTNPFYVLVLSFRYSNFQERNEVSGFRFTADTFYRNVYNNFYFRQF